MPRRPPQPPRRNAREPRRRPGPSSSSSRSGASRRRAIAVWAAAVALALGALIWWSAAGPRPRALRERAEAAERAGDRPGALAAWRAFNDTPSADGPSLLAEARAALALGRAGDAEAALRRSTAAAADDPRPWRLWLEILRVEDRPTDALRVGLAALGAVPADGRRDVLRALTLALLADLPDDLARDTLARWADAGGGTVEREDREGGAAAAADPDALAALYQRMNRMPRAGDPDRDARVAALAALLAREPGRVPAREAMVTALADAGETDRGRAALEAWPADGRDARYWRLLGRWQLEYDRDPEGAARSFARALEELPHDWKTRVRLARALRALGREGMARREAATVNRHREWLDPEALGPLLSAALEAAGPRTLTELADLCERVGLARLSAAWRLEAARE